MSDAVTTTHLTHYHAPATPDGGGALLATVVNSYDAPPGLAFHTDPADDLQAATIVHPPGHEVRAHWHPPVARHVARTMEVLVVTGGTADMDLYDPATGAVCHTVRVYDGHVIVLYGTGHGFRVTPGHIPFRAVEVKQGPYPGPARDKVLIDRGTGEA